MTASPLQLAGLLLACGGAAVAILARDRRTRFVAIWVALLAAPALVAGDVWHQSRFVDIRSHPALLAGLLVLGAAALGVLAAIFERYPSAFPVLAIALLPFRVPIRVGGQTSDLLIPLYGVVAAEAARRAYALFRDGPGSRDDGLLTIPLRAGSRAAVWLPWLLATTLVLYAVQSAYTEDVSNAIENACFFLVPFAILFVLLLEVEWTPRLLGRVLAAVSAAALVFSAVAIWQHAARHLTFNDELIAANQLHTYFRVNSLFHDPNVLGRYLALTVVALSAYVVWTRDLRWSLVAVAVAGVSIWATALTYSLTSFAALIAGLLIVAWLRWGLRVGAALALTVLALAGAYALFSNKQAGCTEQSLAQCSEGRVDLIRGGIDLAKARPVWGYGSGSFGAAFERHIKRAKTTASHSEPITIAAEQGVIGLIPYLALLAVALAVLFAGARSSAGRAAVAACFVAMLVHSLGYAGFTIDPATWALLALGLVLE